MRVEVGRLRALPDDFARLARPAAAEGFAFLERVRDAVTDPVAKARGLVRNDWLEAMLADPNTARTNLGSNALWQVALLEMWLQERGI